MSILVCRATKKSHCTTENGENSSAVTTMDCKRGRPRIAGRALLQRTGIRYSATKHEEDDDETHTDGDNKTLPMAEKTLHTQSTCTCTVKKEEEVKRNYLSSAIESLLLFFYFVRESLFPICDGAISSDKLEATDHRSSDRAGGASSSPGDLPDRLPIMLSPFCALSGKSLLVCLKDEIF